MRARPIRVEPPYPDPPRRRRGPGRDPLTAPAPSLRGLHGLTVAVLWHPDSPGVRVVVRPCLARRLGLVRSEFATLGEAANRLIGYVPLNR